MGVALRCGLLVLLLWPAAVRGETPLAERLDAALGHRGLRGARIAVLVVDGRDGRTLYARDPDRALVPASNLKLLTAMAVLSTFGPEHRFETLLLSRSEPGSDGAIDDLYVRGGGDPALTSEELWRLAADLRRQGLRRIRGDLVLDASLFDSERWHPSWGRVSARAYNAPVGALSANYGAFAVRVGPGAAVGDALGATIDPPVDFLRLDVRARTLPSRARAGLSVDRRAAAGFEEVRLEGGLRLGSAPQTVYRSVLDPVRYAGSVLRMQLEANGIRVEGKLRVGSSMGATVELLRFEGRSLSEIVRLFMKYSNNVIGESLVKAMAVRSGVVPGTWNAGIAAVRQALEDQGMTLGGLSVVDGSGLSYANRVPPRVFVEALRLAERSFRFGPEFVAALPIAGADGTLAERAEAAAYGVRAKTGSLTRVTGLSGYARRPDGGVAVFSLLVNGYRGPTEAVWSAVDGFVAELVGESGQELRPSASAAVWASSTSRGYSVGSARPRASRRSMRPGPQL